MLELQHLRPWEKIEMVVRRHWIIFVFLGFYVIFALSVTFTLLSIFGWYYWVWFVLVLFWMMFLVFLYIQWLNNELDLFIITNNRIVWIDQISFLNRTVSECNLGQVQEVNAQTKWLLANLLNYWAVIIQTAWNSSDFDMTYCPNALNISRKILNIVDHYRDAQKETDSHSWDWVS